MKERKGGAQLGEPCLPLDVPHGRSGIAGQLLARDFDFETHAAQQTTHADGLCRHLDPWELSVRDLVAHKLVMKDGKVYKNPSGE